MKILIIGDLHGNSPIISFKEFDTIILTGDICSDKELSPYYKQYFQELKTNKNIPSIDIYFTEKIGKRKLKQMKIDSLKEGRKILEKLNKLNKPIFIVPGNWDQSYGETKIKDIDKNDYNYKKSFYDKYLGDKINPKLIKGLKNIKDCQYKLHEFKNINIIGYGLSSNVEDIKKQKKKLILTKKQFLILENSYNKILDKLNNQYKKRNKKFPTIFITHNIPYNTKLDLVKNKKSVAYNKHLGSSVARNFCEKNQPLLCIGGHIHEGKGRDKIGNTIIINPGFGKYAQVLIEINKDKIKGIEFWKK